MFSIQSPAAIAQMELDEQTRTALLALLGNCSQPLEHRGPIEIAGEPTGSPPPITVTQFLDNITNEINNHTDEYYAQQVVNNQISAIENNYIVNGFSIYSPGVSYFQNLLVTNLNTDRITVNGSEYCFVDKEVVTDGSLEYSFDADECALELTLTLVKESIKTLGSCP